MRRLALGSILAALALLLAACGNASDDENSVPGGAGNAGPGRAALAITVTGAQDDTLHVVFRCGGRLPDCKPGALSRLDAVVKSVESRGRVCTQQYGGPEKAHVFGNLDGTDVQLDIDRADGCGISDYADFFDAMGQPPPLREQPTR
jgi:hypothetical protein